MKLLMHLAHRLAYYMHVVSGVLLIGMMLTVLLDVITRTLFGASNGKIDLTFPGAVELVSYGLLFTILFTLPYSVSRSQVIVDLFTEKMSERLKAILAGVYTFGFGLLGIGMAIRFFEAVSRVAKTGETSQDLLIPMTYIYAITAVATTVLALRGVLVSIQQIIDSSREA